MELRGKEREKKEPAISSVPLFLGPSLMCLPRNSVHVWDISAENEK